MKKETLLIILRRKLKHLTVPDTTPRWRPRAAQDAVREVRAKEIEALSCAIAFLEEHYPTEGVS